jgi:ABC-type phosphate transport system substrate-binding protein
MKLLEQLEACTRSKGGRAARSAVAVIIALAGIVTLALPADAAIPGSFCEDLNPISGMGSSTQTDLHLLTFIPTYEEVCPPAIGTVDYAGLGDEAGIDALFARDADYTFYTADRPLTAEEKFQIENEVLGGGQTNVPVNHFPIGLKGFSVGYNVGSCTTEPVKLNAEVLSLIYTNVIKSWRDPLIVALNPTLATCGLAIEPAVRYDAAASTYYFKDFMSQRVPAWNFYETPDRNTAWPPTLILSCRGIGDSGMASCLGNPGAIGYLPYQVAHDYGIKSALLPNLAGVFEAPASTPATATWPDRCPAAASSSTLPPTTTSDWSMATLANSQTGYPFCAFTYAFVFRNPNEATNGSYNLGELRNTVDYLTTVVGVLAQSRLVEFGYAPLPSPIRTLVNNGIAAMDASW